MSEYKKRMQAVTARQDDIAGSLGDDEVIESLESLNKVLDSHQIQELTRKKGEKQLDMIKMF